MQAIVTGICFQIGQYWSLCEDGSPANENGDNSFDYHQSELDTDSCDEETNGDLNRGDPWLV